MEAYYGRSAQHGKRRVGKEGGREAGRHGHLRFCGLLFARLRQHMIGASCGGCTFSVFDEGPKRRHTNTESQMQRESLSPTEV